MVENGRLTAGTLPDCGSLCRLFATRDGGVCRILYNLRVTVTKPIEFRGNSRDDLRAFPLEARRDAGHQLSRVQNGKEPDDWKSMSTVGQGVREIRIRDALGAFRVIYLARLADAVFVLHCFQKKTEKTSKHDLDLASKRYRDLLKEQGP